MKKILLPVFISLTAFAIAQPVYFEDFESVTPPTLPANISELDQDGDGFTWTTFAASAQVPWTNNGNIAMSESFSNSAGALNPDNRLIIGPIDMSTLSGNYLLEWEAGATEATSTGWYEENYSVYVETSNTIGTAVFSETLSAGQTLFSRSVNVPSSVIGNSTVYIIFRHHNCTDEWRLGIDNIAVNAAATCPSPSLLSSNNPSTTSVDLGWAAGANETEWNIEYGPVNFPLGSGTLINTNLNPYSLTGLNSSSSYEFYVQAVCSTSDSSLWTGPFLFSTLCDVLQAPYLENFNATFPNCWIQNTNDAFDWTLNSGATTSASTGPSDDVNGGGNYVYIEASVPQATGDSAILTTLDIDVSSLTNPELTFYNHMYGASVDYLRVDVSDNGGSSYSNIFSKSGDQGDQWNQEFIDLSSFSDTIRFKITAMIGDDGSGAHWWSDIAIDNFEIREQPTCPQTSPLNISNITDNSADISWSAGGSETSWNVEYGPSGFSIGSGTSFNVSSTSFSLSNLISYTDYDFYVQGVCDTNDLSLWVMSSFKTNPACGDNFGPYCYDGGSFTVFTANAPAGDFIQINITAGETEVGYDNLQFYDGVGPNGNLLYDADGDHTGASVLSTTGTITMYITGDATWNCIDGVGGPYVPIELTITCTTPSAIDMAGRAMTTSPSLTLSNGPFIISGDLQNMGSNTVTSMDINYSVDGGATVTESVSGLSLATGDYYSFNHGTPWSPSAGTYNIDIWATNINGSADMDTSNDMASGSVTVYANGDIKRPMLESFSSSTCGPCAPGNQNTSSVLALYSDDQYSLLKYQVDFPGAGDPYYTAEVGDRRAYYNVSAVPDFVIDGNFWQGNSNSVTGSQIDAVALNPAFVSLSSYHVMDGQKIDFTVNINPLGDFAGPLTLYSAIFEYQTFNNTGSNGETQFSKVMKKMVPGSSGFSLGSLTDGQTVVENFSYTFQGAYTLPPNAGSPINHSIEHSVEDFSNLGVVTWIQDDATKEILQSTVSVESFTNIEEKPTTDLMVFPNPTENMATISFKGIQGLDISIELYNLLGELIVSENYTSQSNFDYYNLDVSTVNNGIYNLVFKVGETVTTKKLQILK